VRNISLTNKDLSGVQSISDDTSVNTNHPYQNDHIEAEPVTLLSLFQKLISTMGVYSLGGYDGSHSPVSLS
jgi:hypothetical protein